MAKVLVADEIAQQGLDLLEKDHEVTVLTGLNQEELVMAIVDYEALIVRSQTSVTRSVIEAGTQLKAIARAGVGVDNVDVNAATEHGVIVVNAPLANTISTAEHAFALLLATARNIAPADASLRSGKWERSEYSGVELAHKTLGIIGLGRIGSEVAKRAQAFQMNVVAYDPFVSKDKAENLGIEICELIHLFEISDFVTLHTTLNEDTKHLISAEILSHAKPGLRLINAARGDLIDEKALLEAISQGYINQAGLDVFSIEPAVGNPLTQHQNITVTPHLAASTSEAQTRAAVDVAEQVNQILQGSVPEFPVNIDTVDTDTMLTLAPFLEPIRLAGSIASQLAVGTSTSGNIQSAHINYLGNFTGLETHPLRSSAIIGILGSATTIPVNIVNALNIAESTGLSVQEKFSKSIEPYENLVQITVITDQRSEKVSATSTSAGVEIVSIGQWNINFRPASKILLLVENLDQPGEVGRVGQIMGDLGVNISSMAVAPGLTTDDPALMVIGISRSLDQSEALQISELTGISRVRQVTL